MTQAHPIGLPGCNKADITAQAPPCELVHVVAPSALRERNCYDERARCGNWLAADCAPPPRTDKRPPGGWAGEDNAATAGAKGRWNGAIAALSMWRFALRGG
jgi:hypothetical protein